MNEDTPHRTQDLIPDVRMANTARNADTNAKRLEELRDRSRLPHERPPHLTSREYYLTKQYRQREALRRLMQTQSRPLSFEPANQPRVLLHAVNVVREDGRTELVLKRKPVPPNNSDHSGTGAGPSTGPSTGADPGMGTNRAVISRITGASTGTAPIREASNYDVAEDLSSSSITSSSSTCSSLAPSPGRSQDQPRSSPPSAKLGSLCEITECSICMNKYHHEEGKPKVLNCGHTFCLNCLTTLALGPTVRCPTCRERIYLPDGVQGLPTNHSILGLLECCCEDCREHPKYLKCPHCRTSICNICSPSHLEKYKDETSHLLTDLHDLHNRAESVVDASDEAQARLHVDKLRQVIKESFDRTINILREEEKRNLDGLDSFLENGLDNLEQLKEAGKEELQRNSDFMEDTQKKMNGESTFDELKQVREMVDVFSGNLETVLNQVKRPAEMVVLGKQEYRTSVHTVIVRSLPKGKGKGIKRTATDNDENRQIVKKSAKETSSLNNIDNGASPSTSAHHE